MPYYDYRCSECHKPFGLEMSIVHHKPIQPCPRCGSAGMQMPPKGTQFELKGGGWANEGYSG